MSPREQRFRGRRGVQFRDIQGGIVCGATGIVYGASELTPTIFNLKGVGE